MNCNPQLTAEEFSDVHNALCYLRGLQDTGSDRVNQRLKEIVALFEQGLRGAYRQDNAAWSRKHDHYVQMGRDHNIGATSWSIYEVDDLMTAHPWAGATQLFYTRHWGQNPVVVPVTGDTWLALWQAADAAVQQSGDRHHTFVEGFNMDAQGNLEMSTGS